MVFFFFFFNIYLSEIHTGEILIFYRYIVKYSIKICFSFDLLHSNIQRRSVWEYK